MAQIGKTSFDRGTVDRGNLHRIGASLWECSKPRLSAMVIITFAIGIFLGLPAPAGTPAGLFLRLVIASVGLCFLVAGANIWNCWLERDVDAFMARTKNRPLVTGELKPFEAVLGAVFTSGAGLAALYFFTNPLTTTLGWLSLLSYVLLYTPLKRKSTTSLFVGAVPGALPPVMGWTAVHGTLDIIPMLLFWILFLWQLPHFISIAIYRREEYARAGLKTLPLQIGVEPAKWQMLLYATLLVFVSFLPYFLHLAGSVYMGAALLMGLAFVWFCWESLQELEGSKAVRKVFFASLAYLPATLGIWVVEVFFRSVS